MEWKKIRLLEKELNEMVIAVLGKTTFVELWQSPMDPDFYLVTLNKRKPEPVILEWQAETDFIDLKKEKLRLTLKNLSTILKLFERRINND